MSKKFYVAPLGVEEWYEVPAQSSGFTIESSTVDDSIFGTFFQSNQSTLLDWETEASGIYKSVPGYKASLKKTGSSTPFADETTTLVNGWYEIDNKLRGIWDRIYPVSAKDDTGVIDHHIESVDYLFGRIKIVDSYEPTGTVVVTGRYMSTVEICGARSYSLTQTADTENVTTFCTAKEDNGFSDYKAQRLTVSLNVEGFYNPNGQFNDDIAGREEYLLELVMSDSGKSLVRGYFGITGVTLSSDVGNVEIRSVNYELVVPEGISRPFSWYHAEDTEMSKALRVIVDAWLDRRFLRIKYVTESNVEYFGNVVVADASLENSVDDITRFNFQFQGSGRVFADFWPDVPNMTLDFENDTFILKKQFEEPVEVRPEDLFVPNFRPADKLVWNGNRFVVAPAGHLAYMTHPQTGRQMMVVEPTATNLLPHSSDFSISNWGGSSVVRSTIAGIFPGQAGYLLTNNYETSPAASITQAAGPLTGQPQTVYAIAKKGSSSVARLTLRDMEAAAHIVDAAFNFDERSLSLTSQLDSGLDISGDFMGLGNGIFLLWATVTAVNAGNEGRAYFYPGVDGPGTGTILYHVQVENTPYWTSPIVTGDTAITRAGDVLRIDDYDQKVIGADSSGSMFVEYEYPMGELDSNNYYLFAETVDGLDSARQMIYPAAIANRERAYLYQNGTPSIANIRNLDAVGVIRKAAASFGADSLAVALNGRGASDVNTTGLIAGINQAAISSSAGLASRPIWVSKIWRDHTVRTAAELEALTS